MSSAIVHGHLFGEWQDTGLGNRERHCLRCRSRQDGQQPDESVPACSGTPTPTVSWSFQQVLREMLQEIGLAAFSPQVQAEVSRLTGRSPVNHPMDPRVMALAEGAEERRKMPGRVDDLEMLRLLRTGIAASTVGRATDVDDDKGAPQEGADEHD